MTSSPVSAQRTEGGLLGGVQLNTHSASFSQLGEFASCCPQFDGGSGASPYLGAFVTLPLNTNWRIQARIVYSNESGKMVNDEQSFVADLRDTARIVPAVFRHELTASLSTIQFEPFLGFRPIGALDLFVGGSIGYVLSKSFVQTETLAEPEDFGSYLGTGRTWVNHDAEIPSASSIRATVAMGARYVFPLNAKGSLFLAPELFYHIPLTDVTSETVWSVSSLRLGLEVGLAIVSPPEPPAVAQTPADPPTTALTVVPTPLPPSIELVATSPDDPSWKHTSGVLIEETQVVDFIPLLNHVYFEEGSNQIPSRYVVDRSEELVPTDLQGSIRFVIPNIAQRLRDTPSSTVTIVGHVSETNDDRGIELSRSRADAVANVLKSMGVDVSRIIVKTRRLPEMPTRASAREDQEHAHSENRRVEIIPSDPTLLDPLALSSRISSTSPQTISISAIVGASEGVKSTFITTPHGSDSRTIQLRTSQLDTAVRSVVVAGIVTDSAGSVSVDTMRIQTSRLTIEKKRSNRQKDVEIERYSLILFGFNDANVTADHRRQLTRIRERMNQGASVRIIGMTDSMGSSDYNKELSRKRAVRVAEALGLDETAVEAAGDTKSRFDNAQAEGRAYNRTVIIEVRMPVN